MTEPASPSHISYHPPPQLSCPSQAFEHTIFSLQILYRVVPLPETVFLPSIFAWKGPGNFPLSLQISNTASFEKSLWAGVGVTMAAALTGLGLRSVKQVRVQFCSFEKNVESTRTFHQAVSREKVRGANLSCSVTVDVRPSGRRDYAQRAPQRPPRPGEARCLRLPHQAKGGGSRDEPAPVPARTAQKKPANRFQPETAKATYLRRT